MAITIKEFIKEYAEIKKNSPELSPLEIWKMIGDKDSFAAMGFDSEDELIEWIEANPYDSI